jgi:RNA polymerase sigma-70 factor (ECF subfamily)
MSAAVATPESGEGGDGGGPAAEEAQASLEGPVDEVLLACRRSAYLAALQLLGNRDDALDLAQEAVLRILRSRSGLDPSRPWRPYLMRVVTNLARDLWRRRRVRRAESLDRLIVERGFDPVDPADRPDERVSQAELRRRAARALGTLSAAHREVLVLRDYQGLSYAEIAAALEVPLGTVMSRLHNARLQVRAAVLDTGRTP